MSKELGVKGLMDGASLNRQLIDIVEEGVTNVHNRTVKGDSFDRALYELDLTIAKLNRLFEDELEKRVGAHDALNNGSDLTGATDAKTTD